MLSILIPIYNYNACPLAEVLHEQCLKTGIDFEILCFDDASTLFREENTRIADLSFANIVYLPENRGRSKIRNTLVKHARYDWLLFLDADVLPADPNFIQRYLDAINEDTDAVYGGLSYADEKPEPDHLLRWLYGKRREALSVKKRRKKAYESLLFSNLLLRKSVFLQLGLDENIPGYGYEDLLFGLQLKSLNARVQHIQNPALHLRLETSAIFLEKTLESLHNLKTLIRNNSIGKRVTRLAKTHYYIKKTGLEGLAHFLFLKSKSRLKRNILSKHPSLFVFDLYKLGYFCTIDPHE